MAVTTEMIKALRERTGAGVLDCKKALEASDGDMEEALRYLRERGVQIAAKKARRTTKEGLIVAYVHPGDKLGVLVEVNCETDFVARTEEFRRLARDIAMQVAATAPLSVDREGLPKDLVEKEKEFYRSQALREGKPEKVVDRIVEGRMEKFYQENCLLEQPFIKDPERTVRDVVTEAIAKLGENIIVRRFVRYRLGEE
ncbi:MAG TPA: translation elongation factor Ts [Candidatus Latescibacteria bacterium]|nr:translation elongation factor Ts [Candidatus Latescibacterota bacterium]